MIYSVFPWLGKSYTARVTMAGKAIDAESSKFQELNKEVLSLLKSKNINYDPSKTKINSLVSEFRSNVTVDIIVESTTEI